MPIESQIIINVKKGERNYTFMMPSGAPFGEAYDSAFEVLQEIVTFSRQAADNAKRKEESFKEM
jgi:hypothetical protein